MKKKDNILGKWIGKTAKIMGAYANNQLVEHKILLTRTQLIVLKTLEHTNGLSQNDLAFITERDKTSLTRLMNTMEKKQLVYRTSSKVDKRIKLVFMTDIGKDLLEQAVPVVHEIETKITQGISNSDIETAISVLRRVQTNVNNSIGV